MYRSIHMIENMNNVFYPVIDGEKLKCVDIRLKGNKAICNIETYRYYWDCTFLILQEQKEYYLKTFAIEYPSTFDLINDYMEEHNLQFKVIPHNRILYDSKWIA